MTDKTLNASENASAGITAEALIKRAFLSIEDGDFDEADGFLEQALNQNPEKAYIYLGKLMIEKNVRTPEELAELPILLDDERLFQRAVRFATEQEKAQLEEYAQVSRASAEKRQTEEAAKIGALVRRAFISIEDGDFDEAAKYIDQAMSLAPENSQACLAKLMSELKVSSEDELTSLPTPLEDEKFFKRALSFADDNEKARLEEYARVNRAKIEKRQAEEAERLERLYNEALTLKANAKTPDEFHELLSKLLALGSYKDAAALFIEARDAEHKAKNLEELYVRAIELNKRAVNGHDFGNLINLLDSLGDYKDAHALADEDRAIMEQRYAEAAAAKEKADTLPDLNDCIKNLELIFPYKDSEALLKEVRHKKELEEKYQSAVQFKEHAKNIGDFGKLIANFEALGDYKDAPAILDEIRPAYEKLKKAAARTEKICLASFLITAVIAGAAWYYYKSQKEKEVRDAYAAAKNYYAQGNYEQAVKNYRLAAENGNIDAQYHLGLAYDTGQGISKNYSAAVKWLAKPAEQGNADAQYRLGLRYANGEGVPQDYFTAFEWLNKAKEQGINDAVPEIERVKKNGQKAANDAYNLAKSYEPSKKYAEAFREFRKAAEFGHIEAQYNLGKMYYDGRSVEKDYKQAAEWYQKAAEHGYAEAQAELGWMYRFGRGVPIDRQKSIEFYQKAASQGNSSAMYWLGDIYEEEKNYSKAAEWYQKAAERNDNSALYRLGLLYEKGLGVKQDYHKAAELYYKSRTKMAGERLEALKKEGKINKDWLPIQDAKMKASSARASNNYYEAAKFYRVAAEQGDANSQYWLGWLYYRGNGVAKDYREAAKWYRKSAEQGDKVAQNNLGVLYYDGRGVNQDYREAAKWLNKSAEQGLANAQNTLGILYEHGWGVKQDSKRAVELYRKAAEQGDKNGQYDLGFMYEKGRGVTQDYNKAIEWYRKAAAQGDEDAKKRLNALEGKKSPAVLDEASDVQVNKLIAQNRVPLYIRDSGKFFYNPNMRMVRITGDNVRLRSQPNMNSNVIARGDREMWGSIEYLGEWTHPNGDKWIVGLYDGRENYPYSTPEWEKKVIWVSARFARPITSF